MSWGGVFVIPAGKLCKYMKLMCSSTSLLFLL